VDKKTQDERDAAEAKKRGEFEELYRKETDAREKAQEKADAAERKAQLLEVGLSLRDYLAADETRKAYLPNAQDIMPHIERQLQPDAKADEVKQVIEREAKAFMERTGAKKPGTVGAPPAPPRTPGRSAESGNPNTPRQPAHSVARSTF
jgi:hypothetical protein